MKKIVALCIIALLTSACSIDPYTGEDKVSNTAWGGMAGVASGAAIGVLAGGGKGALIGAGSGAILGAGAGYYMDRQEAQLRAKLRNSGVRIQRQGDNLKLIMPGNITFASGSAKVTNSFYPILNSVAVILKEFDKSTIDIIGFTDSSGNSTSNQVLSEERANSVTTYIIRSGVSHQRINAKGYGSRYPVASNTSVMGRSQNRRVEISIRPK